MATKRPTVAGIDACKRDRTVKEAIAANRLFDMKIKLEQNIWLSLINICFALIMCSATVVMLALVLGEGEGSSLIDGVIGVLLYIAYDRIYWLGLEIYCDIRPISTKELSNTYLDYIEYFSSYINDQGSDKARRNYYIEMIPKIEKMINELHDIELSGRGKYKLSSIKRRRELMNYLLARPE